MAATLGGTVEVIGGGKFSNGAVTGAFVYLLNHANHQGDGKDKLPKLKQYRILKATADETNQNPLSSEIPILFRGNLENTDIYSLKLDAGDIIGLWSPKAGLLYSTPHILDELNNGNWPGLVIYAIDAAGGYYSFGIKATYTVYKSDYMQGSLGNYFLKEANYWKNSNPERARKYYKLSTEHFQNINRK